MSSVELPPDEPADVVAAGFMVEACLGISEGDQVRVQEEGHLTLEGAAFGSVKTIFRLSRQWSNPVAVTVWTSIGYGKRPEGRHKQSNQPMATATTPTRVVMAPKIKAPDFRRIELTIKGTSPLVIHRFSAKAIQQMRETQEAGSTARSKKAKEPKDFDALFEGAKHISEEGWEGFHAAAFRNGAISACRLVGFKMTLAKLAFKVEADGFDRVDGAPLVRLIDSEAEQWVTPVRLKASGSVDLRVRPLYREWGANVRIQWDNEVFTADDVVNLIRRVGQQVGIGEGRPDSKESAGLGYGLFELV